MWGKRRLGRVALLALTAGHPGGADARTQDGLGAGGQVVDGAGQIRQTGRPALHAVFLTALVGLVRRRSTGLGAKGILGEFLWRWWESLIWRLLLLLQGGCLGVRGLLALLAVTWRLLGL